MATKQKVKEEEILENHKKKRQNLSTKFYLDKRVKKIIRKELDKNTSRTPKEGFLDAFAWRFSQMESSFDILSRFPILISSTNRSLEKRGMSRVDQFIYHIENYFSSVYIFEQRIKKFSGYIEKSSKKLKCDDVWLKKLKLSQQNISKSLESLIEIRGAHIHDRSYYNKDFYSLELFDRLSRHGQTEEDKRKYKGFVKIKLLLQRHKWRDTIKKNNSVCEALLGMLYESAFKLQKEIYKKIK